MKILQEFKAFALRGNVIDLAIAVVIGGAFSKIISAFVSDLVMPIVGAVMPSATWRDWSVTPLNLLVGHFLGEVVDFLIIAAVLFFVIVKGIGALTRARQAEAPAPPKTRTCPECLESVPAAARRCRACGSSIPVVAAA